MTKYSEGDTDASVFTKERKKTTQTGEPVTGYVSTGEGAFKCGNCIHHEGTGCYHPIMMRNSKQPKNKDGSVKIELDKCCDFQRRPVDK